jgi:hypothetical protein
MNSIKWLMEQLTINGSGAVKTFPELFEKAEEIRKKEIIDAWENGLDNFFETNDSDIMSAEQYYKETYKKD